MSHVVVATIGTTLGGVLTVMLLPLAIRAGGLVAVLGAVVTAALAFAGGRLLAWGAAPLAGAARGPGGPLWAGFLPVRGPDLLIFGIFVVLALAMVVAIARGRAE